MFYYIILKLVNLSLTLLISQMKLIIINRFLIWNLIVNNRVMFSISVLLLQSECLKPCVRRQRVFSYLILPLNRSSKSLFISIFIGIKIGIIITIQMISRKPFRYNCVSKLPILSVFLFQLLLINLGSYPSFPHLIKLCLSVKELFIVVNVFQLLSSKMILSDSNVFVFSHNTLICVR